MQRDIFYNRDLGWLSFNERVLQEATYDDVPLMEKVNFLSIFSSNLDEFYRVRMPILMAMSKLGEFNSGDTDPLSAARKLITEHQNLFGTIFRENIIKGLVQQNIYLLFNQSIPSQISHEVTDYFYNEVMAFIRPIDIIKEERFEPKNNELYFLITILKFKKEQLFTLKIPTEDLPRFFKTSHNGKTYIVFIDDVIRYNLNKIFPEGEIASCYSFKITRDAELNLKDEFLGDVAEQIEKQLQRRDSGLATRFLHQPGIPLRTLSAIGERWGIAQSSFVEGGIYHNLKDLAALPVNISEAKYDKRTISNKVSNVDQSLFEQLDNDDVLINTPYNAYWPILRFFNEAAQDASVTEIYITLYRVAHDSRIVHALINAALLGKKVTVMVELKARFDEANNIKWAKKMKAAGVNIVYSITSLKVHAKVALVKRIRDGRVKYYGLLSTGNFNESTAAFYTDHILMTANGSLLREVELLFMFLAKRKKPQPEDELLFKNLLVAGFNLQSRFLEMIDREIANAQKGVPAAIIIKINNLEEQVLIGKLYDASRAGVKVTLIVRSICCLVSGVPGMSDNITIKRIVDRYLEHGRVFIFQNNDSPQVYLGSADWMNRNIYRRIEVCFPILNDHIKQQIMQMIELQRNDNVKAVWLNEKMENFPVITVEPKIQSQSAIYDLLNKEVAVS